MIICEQQTKHFDKAHLESVLSLLKQNVKNRRIALLIHLMIVTSVMLFLLMLCLLLNNGSKNAERNMPHALRMFQLFFSVFLFAVTVVFTVIHTKDSYSYWHNRRMSVLYDAPPVGPCALFLSKTISAYLFSVVPALVFYGIFLLISLCFGQPPVTDITDTLIRPLLFAPLACISFYGLLAVCCGTTLQSATAFFLISLSYPLGTRLIYAYVQSFFYGLVPPMDTSGILFNLINPLGAWFQSDNAIQWLVFSAVCMALGAFLAKKRSVNSAPRLFTGFPLGQIVKPVASFVIGMMIGVFFGSRNAFGNAPAGFVFGFLLGAVFGCLIIHLLFYKSFNGILKTAVPFAVMVVLTITAVGLSSAEIFGFSRFVPEKAEVESAGIVAFDNIVSLNSQTAPRFAADCADDYSDSDAIDSVINIHRLTLKYADMSPQEKFADVQYFMVANTTVSNLKPEKNYCIGYKLKNGNVVTRLYRPVWSVLYKKESVNNDIYKNIDRITQTKRYKRLYRSVMYISADNLKEVTVNDPANFTRDDNSVKVDYDHAVVIENNARTKADLQKLMAAMQKDVKENDSVDGSQKSAIIEMKFQSDTPGNFNRLFHKIFALSNQDYCMVNVYDTDVNTLNVLKETGILARVF